MKMKPDQKTGIETLIQNPSKSPEITQVVSINNATKPNWIYSQADHRPKGQEEGGKNLCNPW